MRFVPSALVLCATCAGLVPGLAAQDDPAARTFQLAEELLGGGRTEQAVEAFERIVDSYPDSPLADDALLELAIRYFPADSWDDLQLALAPAVERATPYLDRILRDYPAGDRAAEAGYLRGLTYLVPGSVEQDLDEAFAAFHEVVTLHPTSPRVPAARRGLALVELRMGRPGAGMLELERLLLDTGPGPVADRAMLDLADGWVRVGEPLQAMDAWMEVRARTRESSVRLAAEDGLRRTARFLDAQAAHSGIYQEDRSFAARNPQLDEVRSLALDGSGVPHVLADGGRAWVRLGSDGRQQPVREARALFREPGGMVGWAEARRVHLSTGTLELQKGKDRSPLVSVAMQPDGRFVVVEENGRGLVRFTPDGRFLGRLADSARVDSVVTDRRGWIYALDSRQRTVRRFRPDGTPAGRFGPEGIGYRFESPLAMAVDESYHVYVLDGKTAAIEVLDPGGTGVARLELPRQGPDRIKEPRALAVERSGAVIVLDGKSGTLRRFD